MEAKTLVELDLSFVVLGIAFDPEAFDEAAFDSESFWMFPGAETEQTFRFSTPTEVIEPDSIPVLEGVQVTPAVVDPGGSIGIRASISVALRDFMYPLNGTDFYTGTFFGKLRAIKPSLQGSALRVLRGEFGDLVTEMVTEHYVVESSSRTEDRVTIVAKDLLKLTEGDRSQAPAISNGRLLVDIDESVTSLTLQPAGIGDAEYPASGKATIGGSEIVSFTRSGDAMGITRAQEGTVAEAHDEDDIVQVVLEYASLSPAAVVYDLVTNYTDIDPAWCPLSEWQDDIEQYNTHLYSAVVAEPTPIKDLLDQIIVEAGLVMWWDEIARKVRLKSLRPVTSPRVIAEQEMIANTFRAQEQPRKRKSQAWSYYAVRNPTEPLEQANNYRSGIVTVDLASDTVFQQTAICKTFCRYIGKNNRPAASRLNSQLISRFTYPPRHFTFEISKESEEPQKGQGIQILHSALQHADGSLCECPAQIVSVEKTEENYRIDAEEMLFTEVDDGLPPGARLIVIDSDSVSVNLRTLHDSLYSSVGSGDLVVCVIEEGIKVGHFVVGGWPGGVDITLQNRGLIQGAGGKGGSYVGGTAPGNGGTALFCRRALTLENEGEIRGGGGGGSSAEPDFDPYTTSGGGGGAGYPGGAGGAPRGKAGTVDAGGAAGGFGAGKGGNPGMPGGDGLAGAGGDPGIAIDGISFIAYSGSGSVVGAEIN